MKDHKKNRPGYKKTKVGWIPSGWKCSPLADIAYVQTGLAIGKKNLNNPTKLPYLRIANVQSGFLDLKEIKEIEVDEKDVERYQLRSGDVLFTEGGDFDKLGRGTIWKDEIVRYLHQNHVFAVRCDEKQIIPDFLSAFAAGPFGRWYFNISSKQSTNLASINSTQLRQFSLPLPPLPEQQKIAEILSAWDEAIGQTRKLIDAKKRRKKVLMQQLLTGKKRVPGFSRSTGRNSYRFFDLPENWEYPQIRDVAHEYSERNTSGDDLTVLACSKHLGFVESSEYFGKQVLSADTSNYKVILRNYFGYPSNHIEEGSIGLLLSHDIGIVNPIYTVFQCNDSVIPEYIYAIFKTDTFRHIFAISTNASVDRRGGLRWREFSLIRVPLPSIKEQQAIVDVLNVANNEIVQSEKKLKALEKQKRGLMQKLLTGEVRVAV